MEVKDYFEQIPNGRRYIRQMERNISLSREMMPSISSKPFDLEFTTGSRSLESPQEREVKRIMELEEYLAKYKTQFQHLIVEADILLTKVKDLKIQSAMRFHYIYGKSREEISRIFNRDERTVRRWFSEGFKDIQLPSKAIDMNQLCEKCPGSAG